MNLRDIDVFNAIMVSGGTVAAADLLGVSQPSVSRSLSRLERDVGFRLFDRIRGRLVATREGQLFHGDIRANLLGLDRLKQRAAQIREVGDGAICIASLPALGYGLVPRAIARFSRRHDHVRVVFEVRSSNFVRDLVASGRADVGLAADEIDSSGVQHTVFATPRAVCVLPKRHRLGHKARISIKDLAGEPLIALAPEDTTRRTLQRIAGESQVQLNIAIETSYGLSIAILAAQGVGVGLVNPLTIRDGLVSNIIVKPFDPAIHFRTLLLRPPGAPTSQLIKALCEELYAVRNHFSSST